MLKVLPARCDVGAAVVQLTDELVSASSPTVDTAFDSLDRLRRRLIALEARVWIFDGARGRCAFRAGGTTDSLSAPMALYDDAAAISRLRHNGAVYCRFGDVSGLAHLAPAGARSFVAAAATVRDSVSVVLVVAWTQSRPPCDESDVAYLRIAAAVLGKAATASASTNDAQVHPDAILDSLSDRVALVDRDGTIVAVNAAWIEFGRQQGTDAVISMGPGTSYFETCRRAAANGCHEAGAALAGIEAVCNSVSESFEMSYVLDGPAGQRWCVMRVTPLNRPEGGAVIAHAEVKNSKASDLARRIGDGLFHGIVDALPVPVWIAATDGRVLYANQRWRDSIGMSATEEIGNIAWVDAMHPHDRSRAKVAFRSAVTRREPLDIELRIRSLDGTYRWSACAAVPQYATDGSIESYVGLCWDISGKRRAESAFTEVAAKLVAAQEAERSRIARELHDDLGQQIALLSTKLEMLAGDPRPSRTRMESSLTDTCRSLQEIATTVHSLSHQLHPAKLRLLGLTPTLEALCREVAAKSNVSVSFAAHAVPTDLSEDSALCLFRVSQEALQNAVKHSAARHISVQLRGTTSQIVLQVTDSGRGFSPTASQSPGLGLLTMRERVESLGGTLRIEMAQHHGTTVRITVPLKRFVPGSQAS
jgi:PAS domain S-box-containing protein